jgi:cobalt-zinc-cadmium efflux system protein
MGASASVTPGGPAATLGRPLAPTLTAAARQRGRLQAVLALTVLYLVVEAVTGWLSGSLALVADAAHMATDALGLGLALLAVWLSRRPAPARRTFGHYRAEVLAALANGVLMLAVAGYILWEAYGRLRAPGPVATGPMLLVAGGGLLVNALAVRLLRDGAGESLNSRAAFLEVLGDLLASAGVIVAGLVTRFTGWLYADPLVSVAIALFILPRAFGLLRQSADVLLEATPERLEVDEVAAALRAVPGVRAVHDLHVWTITSGMESVTAHLVLKDGLDAAAGQEVLTVATRLLDERFGLDHATLQLEATDRQAVEVPH